MTRWGIVTTILAPPRDLLRFAAYHLEAGAHRLYLYLDAPSEAFNLLKSHPKIRPTLCDAAHWKRLIGKRPPKHQVRQTLNATHAYHRRIEVDWLAHIDVDEFLVGDVGVALSGCVAQGLRVRPMELLAGSEDLFKAWIPPGPARDTLVARLYPAYGACLKGGFLSHVAGKLFLRTGLEDVKFRIHNGFFGEEEITDITETPALTLAHLHARNWQDWRAHYSYRLQKGAYRADLPPHRGGLSVHEMLRVLDQTKGENGLRAFFTEVAEDSPKLRARLEAEGLLRRQKLDLDAKITAHFPDFQG